MPTWQDGPGGFFRGYTAFLARDLPFDAIGVRVFTTVWTLYYCVLPLHYCPDSLLLCASSLLLWFESLLLCVFLLLRPSSLLLCVYILFTTICVFDYLLQSVCVLMLR